MMRNSPDELLDNFDLPLLFSSTAVRNTTTTPVQSLLLINSELMSSHAKHLASLSEPGSRNHDSDGRDPDVIEARILLTWQRVYGRPPTPVERAASLEFLQSQTDRITQPDSGETAFIDFCHALLNSNEFLYVR